MCELSYAQRALDEVAEPARSPEAGRVLLPRATLAVDALKQLQNGFFAHRGYRDSGLQVPSKRGVERVKALRRLLPLTFVCSATEGTHSEAARHQLTGSPAAHNGDIPVDLPDLAYLYLLHLLTRPQDLRRRTPPGQAGGS